MNNLKIESYTTPPPDWNDFVRQHPGSKLYHLHEWNQVVHASFGHPIKYLVIKSDEKIRGILPLTEFKSYLFGKFAVSLPFINYGGPLLQGNKWIEPLRDYLTQLRSQNNYDYIELRLDSVIDEVLPSKQHKVTFYLDLPSDSEELWSFFKAKLRSQIRRPTKENMTVRSGGIELLDEFYKIFAINMRDLGTPVLPKYFFKNIMETFPENSFIVVVDSAEKNPIAASFLIKYKHTLEIPWASSLKEYNRFSPNMLLYWESLKLAIEKKCTVFDFGRCTPGSGTYRFKKQWKAREHPLCWSYVLPNNQPLPELNPENEKFSLAIKVWTKLPLSITKLLGPQIIKNIP